MNVRRTLAAIAIALLVIVGSYVLGGIGEEAPADLPAAPTAS